MSVDEGRWYLVRSPEYTYVEVAIPETGQGPTMDTRDVAVIRARTAKDAKWAAVRLWEQNARPSWECWPAIARGEHAHPLAGVTAERWPGPLGERGEPDRFGWGPFYADILEVQP